MGWIKNMLDKGFEVKLFNISWGGGYRKRKRAAKTLAQRRRKRHG